MSDQTPLYKIHNSIMDLRYVAAASVGKNTVYGHEHNALKIYLQNGETIITNYGDFSKLCNDYNGLTKKMESLHKASNSSSASQE